MLSIGKFVHTAGAALCALFIFAAGTGPLSSRQFTLFDDAMISMTYARTLAETGTWNWFPGAETVQGFTNLGWTIWMSLLHLFPLDGSSISFLVSLSSLLTLLGTALLTERIVDRAIGPSQKTEFAPIVAASLVYLSYPLLFWSLRGMEVGLLALVTMFLVWLYLQLRTGGTSTGFLLAQMFAASLFGVWVRMDFFVIPATIALVSVLFFLREKNRRFLAIAAPLFAGGLLGVFSVMIFQFFAWGDVLPNTFYLKATGVSLAERLPRGILASLKLLPVSLIVALMSASLLKRFRVKLIGEIVVIGVMVSTGLMAYSIYVGGDAWEDYLFSNRYFAPALPLFAMIIGLYLAKTDAISPPYKVWITSALPIVALGMAVTANEPFQWWVAALALVSFLVLSVSFMAATSRCRNLSKGAFKRVITTFSVLAYVLAVSGIGVASAIKWGGIQATSADAQMTLWGKELEKVTREDAVIAVVWAGAPVYYSNRPAVDLLGKNDRRIAKMDPPTPEPGTWNEKFVPGHNKWDFDWSISNLEPDVVFQYIQLSGEESKLRRLGYRVYCLSDGLKIHVHKDSQAVFFDKLRTCSDSSVGS